MKHQNRHSFVTDDQAVQMGADMAIQFMLMMLFQVVSEMALAFGRSRGALRADRNLPIATDAGECRTEGQSQRDEDP
jgi:hypothetical protein